MKLPSPQSSRDQEAHWSHPRPHRDRRRVTGAAAGLILFLLLADEGFPSSLTEGHISFRNEVMAVLSKAGCNAGPCHGNQNGKAGFKLSLRGEDPDFDHIALTRDLFGRRVDPAKPEASLVLLKATTQLAHEGGLRFRVDSEEFAILRQWIAGGAEDDAATAPSLARLQVTPAEQILLEPTRELQLRVEAMFSDGTRRDVTSRAVYEPASTSVKVNHDGLVTGDPPSETTVLVRFLSEQVPVRLAFVPARKDFTWQNPPAHNYVDEQIFAKLRTLRVNPSAVVSDGEFIRRAMLDLLGLLPTAQEARAFVADRRQDKRARLVKALVERPEFADFWALKWSDVLRNEEKVLDRKGVQLYYRWIRESLARNKPIDQFVRELLSARGSTYVNPAANFYRANRDAVTRAEATAQLFLGTRLQCAKCHNHPFDHWTQADYYDWADVFARVQYKVIENNKRDGLDSHEFIGEQIVYTAREGGINNPRTGKPARARFLGERPSSPPPDSTSSLTNETATDDLQKLAAWVTAQPGFARAQVNWVWFQLFGRGIVDPIDDFRPTNPASHPALLDALAKDFTRHHFDLRYLLQVLMNSRTYQLSAEPTSDNAEDTINFSHVWPRRLSAEQLLDTQSQVLDLPARFSGYPVGFRAAQLPGGSPVRRNEMKMGGAEKFLALFGKPARLLACECERSSETTLGQTFQLISSPDIQRLLSASDNRLTALLAANYSNERLVDELYWTALTRAPSGPERSAATRLLSESPDRRSALEDLAWALLNAKEFVLRR
ncbi:MAG TPA: DUF1549 domain-containing protein [Verrucomicrobiae bacterium]|nr:DUF1549 domain-containing protein [Verrucomicrobiae bacterium]